MAIRKMHCSWGKQHVEESNPPDGCKGLSAQVFDSEFEDDFFSKLSLESISSNCNSFNKLLSSIKTTHTHKQHFHEINTVTRPDLDQVSAIIPSKTWRFRSMFSHFEDFLWLFQTPCITFSPLMWNNSDIFWDLKNPAFKPWKWSAHLVWHFKYITSMRCGYWTPNEWFVVC